MWKNLRIRTRLFIGFGILLVFFIVIGWFFLQVLKHEAETTKEIYDHPFMVSNAARDIYMHTIKMQRGVRDAILSDNDFELNEALQTIDESEQLVLEKMQIIKERFPENNEWFDQFIGQFKDWKPMREGILNFVREGKKKEAVAALKEKRARQITLLTTRIQEIVDFAEKKVQQLMAEANAYEQNVYIVVVIITLATVIIAFFIAYTITMSITRPLHLAVDVANHLAMNDISIDIEKTEATDETGILLRSMKEMVVNLRKQIKDITAGVNIVAGSAAQISTTTTQFTSSFNEIAAAISETATSMKEVKQTSELSSEKFKYVSDSARNVLQVSRGGEKAVNETIAVINGIREQMAFIAESILGLSEQTQSIWEITTVVDDIAGQSRLLAVNASIEAIKAGEQGKGFSVVASEIKNLALQSRQSTNQVRTILSEVQKATGNSVMVTEKANKFVDNGAKQAAKTSEAIQALGQSIQESSQASMQIEATVRQQMTGIEQVFSAMENINAAIIQNAEGARHLETAARNLDELGENLKKVVQKYKL